MIGSSNSELEAFRQAGIAAIQQIYPIEIHQFSAFHNPPHIVLAVLQCVQIILAGNYGDITLDPATNEIKENDWYACRRMACQSAYGFLEACRNIFDKFENDSYLDARVQSAKKRIQSAELTLEKVQKCSIVCGKLFIWMENVVRYWELFKSKNG